MIKQQIIPQGRPEFGDMTQIKQRRAHLKPVSENTKPPKKVEHPCKFQVFIPGLDSLNRSKPCQNEAQANGWCEEHQHAQEIMDLGKKLSHRSVEIPVVFYQDGREPFKIIIGQGELNWEAYAERATGKGLNTVLDYLRSRC